MERVIWEMFRRETWSRSHLVGLMSRYFPTSIGNFDSQGYLQANPDVAIARRNPLLHYLLYGKREGRRFIRKNDPATLQIYAKVLSSGYFDPDWYVRTYPDVRQSGKNPLEHFCEIGVWKGRDPGPDFSTSWYLERNPDVQGKNPLEHFIDYGMREGRSPSPSRNAAPTMEDFDGHGYLLANPDVAVAGQDPSFHYLTYGKQEGRRFIGKSDLGTVTLYTKFLSSGYFDPNWYVSTYPDVRGSGRNPLQHFCEIGVWEGRDPGPDFSTSWYLEQNADIHGKNPLEHFIDHGLEEGRSPMPPKGVLPTAEDIFNSVRDLDAELGGCEDFHSFNRVPICDGRPKKSNRLKPILKKLVAAMPAETQRLVFVPWLRHTGADLVAANAVRAVVEEKGAADIAVIIVDYDVVEARDWIPDGVAVLSIPAVAADLTIEEKSELIELLLRVSRPAKILNVNSNACWYAIRRYGAVLARYCEIYACLFCRDYTPHGGPAGYSDVYLRDTIANVKKIYLDNATFVRELTDHHSLVEVDRAKLTVLKQPMSVHGRRPVRTRRAAEEMSILWASRIAKQKNWPLLAEIIASSPREFRFHIWGDGAAAEMEELRARLGQRPNVSLHGKFRSFHDLPLADYDVFLYTSLWDGIPNVLLEAASHGLPVVAPKIGGIPELLDNANGWLLEPHAPARDHVAVLYEIRADLKAATEKACALQDLVRSEHGWARYKSALIATDEFAS